MVHALLKSILLAPPTSKSPSEVEYFPLSQTGLAPSRSILVKTHVTTALNSQQVFSKTRLSPSSLVHVSHTLFFVLTHWSPLYPSPSKESMPSSAKYLAMPGHTISQLDPSSPSEILNALPAANSEYTEA
jgi:hypothetical protein